MAEINIQKRHQIGKQAAAQKIENFAQRFAPKYNLRAKWENGMLSFTGAMASGTINVTATDVRVAVNLSSLALLAKGTIQQEIQNELNQAFG
jgi:putative polyhydroxyalkanoate system protein